MTHLLLYQDLMLSAMYLLFLVLCSKIYQNL